MEYDLFDILTWVLIVLVAGFVGQFGKTFAKWVMTRVQKKREADSFPGFPLESGNDGKAPGSGEAIPLTHSSSQLSIPRDGTALDTSKNDLKKWKKMQKTLVKAQKKQDQS